MKGITITLYERVQTDTDSLNCPVYTETPVTVSNVLVAPVSDTEASLGSDNLAGRKAVYQLGIPKGDTHEWTAGMKVNFFGKDWRIIGFPTKGIDNLIPLGWNMKVKVEKYEQG